jgi:endonuclease/exonuclease/phosphatase family metal-dependent hydrolase
MEMPVQIRLASYNVRKCVGLDRRRKPGRIIDVLNSLAADVIALQEADRRLGPRPAALPARLIEEETDFQCLEVSERGPSIGWHGNAVLVRKGLACGNVERLELPGTEPRGALLVQIGGRFHVVAAHLGLLRRDRRRQLRAIAERLREVSDHAVILGDFNEWARTRGLEPLQGAYTVNSPGFSYHAARPVVALDRIAHGAGLELSDAGVVQSRVTRVASDHLPIWADVRISG